MKTDSLFYVIFKRLPDVFFELLGEDPGRASEYHFSSIELKETSFRVDGLLRPVEDSPGRSIYFVEVKFQKEPDFYWNLFSEIFIFLKREKPAADWHAVAIFAQKSMDPGLPMQFRALEREHLSVVYLDDLASAKELSPGMSLVQLIVTPEEQAIEAGRKLRERLEQEPGARYGNPEIMELFATILVYKFPKMSRKEIEVMFQLEDIRKSVVYQEALDEGKLEGKLETVPLLLKNGMSVEHIAQELGLDIEAVQEAAAKSRKRRRRTNGSSREPA